MATLRWASFWIFMVCMGVFSTGFRDLAVLTLALVMFLICMWTFREKRPARPVSPYFERQQALSTLDRRDGVGTRKV
jgi:flagellar biogenesis protein FliO